MFSSLQDSMLGVLLMLLGGLFPFALISFLVFYFIQKIKLRKSENSVAKLQKSFEDLDEQAKLIVKTDLELNNAQEELARRLKNLEALERTSSILSKTLDEKEIILRLEKTLLTDIGFEKNLLLMIDEKEDNFRECLNLGFVQSDVKFIIENFLENTTLLNELKKGALFSSLKAGQQSKEAFHRLFDLPHFIVAPILAQNHLLGILIVGNKTEQLKITGGDEELLGILTNQVGQALENAKLFEEVFMARQGLENKIQERTKELEEALRDVQEISKAKSEFVSAVSHELRTPLTSIKGFASILIAGKLGEIPQSVKDRLEKINNQSDNLVHFINNLLDISRIESGRIEMNLADCNITEVIESAHDLLTPQLKQKNINWVVNAPEAPPSVSVDRSQYERIFINLVSNAIKFTPEEGTISVSVEQKGNVLEIAVSDTGIGISPEDIKKLFDEFYRVENTINKNVKGTGLGLALVKKIVEAHQGRIWITSEVGRGTTFHFTLPFQQQATNNI